MKTWMISGLAAMLLASASGFAAEDVGAAVADEFGSNFTAHAPEALQDDELPVGVVEAEGLNEITPAAGDSVSVPSDVVEGSDMLPVPENALIPGMEQNSSDSIVSPLPASSQEE